MTWVEDDFVPPHKDTREDGVLRADVPVSKVSNFSGFSEASAVVSSSSSSTWTQCFSFGKTAPYALYAIRGAPGENSQLFSLHDGRRVGGVRFAEVGEHSVPGRLVISGVRQLVVIRRNSGSAWNLVGVRGSEAPLAQATKIPGRRRFLLQILREDDGVLNEFVLDGEARGRKVLVYRRVETCRDCEDEAPFATILWGRFRRGDGVGNGGLVRIQRFIEGDILLFSVWLSMLLWRKRAVGGRNECLNDDALPGTMHRTVWREMMA